MQRNKEAENYEATSENSFDTYVAIQEKDTTEDDWPIQLKGAVATYCRNKRQGEFTLEDYYALPDDVRVELIDGILYNMPTPSFIHQAVVVRVIANFCNYVENKHIDDIILLGPIDVQLNQDERTIVQPDVLILCDRNKVKDEIVYGAPDLVVEVLSPYTSLKDRTVKLRKYREAGVREYWIIDMKKEEVDVYIFQDPEFATLPQVYSFNDLIPVRIYSGDCVVDFSQISRRIRRM